MGNIGPGELLFIFFVGLIVLGPTKLPKVARQVAQVLGELRKISQNFQQEMNDALNQVAPPTDPVVHELPTVNQDSDPSPETPGSAEIANGQPHPEDPS